MDLCWLKAADISLFCKAVRRKGTPLRDVWGFIDGTFRPCYRQKVDQKTIYSGHYRLHGLKFQPVMAPNGLVVNLDGPWPGRRQDSGMLAESGLLVLLKNKMAETGNICRLYGYPVYPISEYLEAPFRAGAAELTQEEKEFNEAMSGVRMNVEWGSGEVVQQFAFLDYSKNLEVLWQPVGTLYTVGTHSTNCIVCLGHAEQIHLKFIPLQLNTLTKSRKSAVQT
ncbi:hypothetical protein RvY_08953 [Ramazzottius varieornatus]|uniref:DDE Tnp4 domain-containing protein n=1 Tax=Ramazzottius varieornatus TaxID=947166 RepID=A0A1D1VFM9_RAMVA|nr:hypothetical protein RvY_08953 [Ramazzottius varieornatus]